MNSNKTQTQSEEAGSSLLPHEQLLDAYLLWRSPTIGDPNQVLKQVSDNKTTAEIQDELSEMDTIPPSEIISMLLHRGYHFTTDPDGRVKWEIYRTIV